MPANNNWWSRQIFEAMKDASRLLDRFRESPEPNVDDLDKAMAIHEEYCQAYDLNEITLEEFTEFGKSLRARQAHTIMQKDFNHE